MTTIPFPGPVMTSKLQSSSSLQMVPSQYVLKYFPVTKSSKTGRKVVPFVVRDNDFFFWTTLVFCGQGEAAKYIQSSVLLQPSYFCL